MGKEVGHHRRDFNEDLQMGSCFQSVLQADQDILLVIFEFTQQQQQQQQQQQREPLGQGI